MNGNKLSALIAILVIILIAGAVISMAQPNSYRQPYYSTSFNSKSNSIKDLLSRDSNFTFHTAKSEPGESSKAFIFSTPMSVSEAATYIKAKRRPFDTSDMNSNDKIILTYDDEYAIIYSVANDNGSKETFVQASTRQYAYRTYRRGLYNPYRSTVIIPFPVYYERKYYNSDNERYGTYRSSRSVRTGSSSSSNSRGGGTSFGK